MKQLLLIICFIAVTIAAKAQNGIGTDNPNANAALEIAGIGKGVLYPRYATTARPTGLTAVDTGLTYFDTTLNGYYAWDGTQWTQDVYGANSTGVVSVSTGFSSSFLGYEPVKSADKATVPIAPGGATATLLGCKTNPANGHVYCAYQLSAGTNFYNTYLFAKNVGGYLVTMTNHAERIWVNTNILANGTGYNLNNNIWIGYNKIAYPGNPTEFVWMTGEDFKVDWSTSPAASAEHWFQGGEPNNAGGNEGSCQIYMTPNSATRLWNDLQGTNTAAGAGFDQVIIEFNE